MPPGVGYADFQAGDRYRDDPGIAAAADYLNERGIPITGDNLARAMVAIQSGAGGVQQNFTGIDVTQGDPDFDPIPSQPSPYDNANIQTVRAPSGPFKERPPGSQSLAAQHAANDPIPSQPSPFPQGRGQTDISAADRELPIPDVKPPIPGEPVPGEPVPGEEEREHKLAPEFDDSGVWEWIKQLLVGAAPAAVAGVQRRPSPFGRGRPPPAVSEQRAAARPWSAGSRVPDEAPVRPTTRPATQTDGQPMGRVPEEMRLAMDAARRGDVDALRALATSQDEIVRAFAETQLAVLERARTGVLHRRSPDPRSPRGGAEPSPWTAAAEPNVADTLAERKRLDAARRVRRFGLSR